jgi:hypothetical protein
MLPVTRLLPRRPVLLSLGLALSLLLAPLTASADSSGLDPTSQADSLWNQPQGTRPDSAFYVIQAWWDSLTRATSRDPKQRGLQELSQANNDLLNAYTLLEEQRTDPGPHPVAVIDPLLSGAYGIVTGVHVKAPVGSLFGWINNSLVHLEGRGNTETIIRTLLNDYQVQRTAASRDLDPSAADPLWSANSTRETAMLQKIGSLENPSQGLPVLVAAAPGTTSTAPASAPGKGKSNGKSNGHGQSGDPHGQPAGHQPEKH